MTTFETLKNTADSPSQVRKIVAAMAYLAPYEAAAIETITGADGSLTAVPTGYKPVGLVSSDGFEFGSDTSSESTTAFGYSAPIREDITEQTQTVSFTAMEAFRADVLAIAYGMDLSTVKQSLSGEIVIDRPALPEKRFYRLIVIGKDGAGANEIFRAKHFPRVAITSVPSEAWGADAVSFEIELTAFVDDALGTAQREFIGGPGAKTDKVALGFTQATV